MEIFISIDGVLRNTLQKFEYHYNDYYYDSEPNSKSIDIDKEETEVVTSEEEGFEYFIIPPIQNDNILNCFKFQNEKEYEYFRFIEFAIEINGHAGLSELNVISTLNKIIRENPEHNFTIVGLDELGRTKPGTLFFLSKNAFVGDNIKFITSEQISDTWKQCDYWFTDNKSIVELCPEGKNVYKYETIYNEHFTIDKQINKLNQIIEICTLKFLENNTTSTLMELPTSVESSDQNQ
jgi:hypothetical protein